MEKYTVEEHEDAWAVFKFCNPCDKRHLLRPWFTKREAEIYAELCKKNQAKRDLEHRADTTDRKSWK